MTTLDEKLRGPAALSRRAALLCLVGLLLVTAGHSQAPVSERDGVVKVSGNGATGSGVIVSIQDEVVYVLTAYHVVARRNELEISFLRDPHRPFPAEVVEHQFERGDDGLSLLRVDIEDSRGLLPLRFSQRVRPPRHLPVYAVGFFAGGEVPWSVTEGRILDEQSDTLLFTGAIEEGNSGGPLLQEGEIVGIVTRKFPGHNIAVASLPAQRFAESILGVLPVLCDAPLIPAKPCQERLEIDRLSCDFIKAANRLYEDGDYERAIREYDRAIAHQPDYAVLYNNRGAIKSTRRDFGGAIDDFHRALSHDPDYTVAEVNGALIEIYELFFSWAEEARPPERSPWSFLSLLGSEAIRSRTDDKPEKGASKVLNLFVTLSERYHDYLQMEDRIESFDRGDFSCYGGDIIAANNELNRELARQLASHMGTLRQ